jgi:hypothetical protein
MSVASYKGFLLLDITASIVGHKSDGIRFCGKMMIAKPLPAIDFVGVFSPHIPAVPQVRVNFSVIFAPLSGDVVE